MTAGPGDTRATADRVRHGLPAAIAALVAVVICGPILRPGFVLRYDLVSVPRPVLGEDALGLGDRLPRAIPLDAAVALLATVFPDALLTQFLGLLALTLAGWGVAVLTPAPLTGRLLALLVAEWNPFVLEQLAIGHLPHLFGYAALPWVAVFGRALAAAAPPSGGGSRGPGAASLTSWGGLTAAAGFGSLTPGGGVLVVIAGLAGLAAGSATGRPPHHEKSGAGRTSGRERPGGGRTSGRERPGAGRTSGGERPGGGRTSGREPSGAGRRSGRGKFGAGRRIGAGVVSLVVLQLPWLVAAAAAPAFAAPAAAADGGITAFALRSETGWGRLVDAAGLAGMWNAAALPDSRGTVLARVSTVLLLVLAAAGVPAIRRLWRAGRQPELLAAACAAGIGYLVAVLPVLPGGERLLRSLIDVLPGAGLLRDGHRWLALPAVVIAVLCGLGVGELASRRPAGGGAAAARRVAVAVFAALLVVASMPDLAGGLAGRLQAREYPAQWAQARQVLDASDDRARVLVLPWQPFRVFGWSGPDPVLDPAPRLLPRQSIVSDALTVSGRRLPEEGLGARQLAADLEDGELSAERLRSLAIGWVLIERGTPGRVPGLPPGWNPVLDGPDLTLVRAPGALPAAPRAGTARTGAVIGTQAVAAVLCLLGLLLLVRPWIGAAVRRRGSLPATG